MVNWCSKWAVVSLLLFAGCENEPESVNTQPAAVEATVSAGASNVAVQSVSQDEIASKDGEMRQIREAAERDLPGFLRSALRHPERLGFEADDTEEKVSLGPPVECYELDDEMAASLDGEASDLGDVVQPTGEWLFPVQSGGQYRAVLSVQKRGGQWRGGYLGGSRLATNLQRVREAWSEKQTDHFKLIWCISPRGVFFLVSQEGQTKLTAMTPILFSGGRQLEPPSDWRQVTPAEDVVQMLRDHWAAERRDDPEVE
jgi:hypothetical protein